MLDRWDHFGRLRSRIGNGCCHRYIDSETRGVLVMLSGFWLTVHDYEQIILSVVHNDIYTSFLIRGFGIIMLSCCCFLQSANYDHNNPLAHTKSIAIRIGSGSLWNLEHLSFSNQKATS